MGPRLQGVYVSLHLVLLWAGVGHSAVRQGEICESAFGEIVNEQTDLGQGPRMHFPEETEVQIKKGH